METLEPRENRNEKIREQIRHLTALLEDYSDEIPEQMISGSGNYKVRGNWWQGFFDSMDYAIQECGATDTSIKTETDAFYEKFRQRRQEWRDAISAGTAQGDFLRTTKEEIDTANQLLKRLIENLQNSI